MSENGCSLGPNYVELSAFSNWPDNIPRIQSLVLLKPAKRARIQPHLCMVICCSFGRLYVKHELQIKILRPEHTVRVINLCFWLVWDLVRGTPDHSMVVERVALGAPDEANGCLDRGIAQHKLLIILGGCVEADLQQTTQVQFDICLQHCI